MKQKLFKFYRPKLPCRRDFENSVRIALRRLVKVLEKIFCDKQEKLSTFQK